MWDEEDIWNSADWDSPKRASLKAHIHSSHLCWGESLRRLLYTFDSTYR